MPGLHLRNRQISLDGEQVPAIIPALVIHAVNNYDTQKKNGSGVYYYVPKIETWQEARLVSSLLKRVEEALGLPRGSLKIKMLNERAEYALQQEAIMWVLRENLIGPNVGRWDYLNSREEMFRHDPAMVIPDPNTVTMTEPSLTYYTMRNALLALLAGGMPIGGMAAQMQNPQAPENDAKALRDIWFDKLRERLTGLFKINGKIHDTYRQSWVATIAPAYVEAGREPLVTDVDDLQTVVDKLKPDEKKRLEDLGLLKDGTIAPLELSEADLTPEKLFSEEARKKLLSRPQGPTTEDGLRYAMYMSTEFMYQQLLGNNAAAIYDPRTGLRFMNDLATYEIFWHFLYLTVFHGVELTADGKYSKEGDRVTPELFLKLLDERRETVKELFAKLGTVYEKTNAELVLTMLKRQVVEEQPGRPRRAAAAVDQVRLARAAVDHRRVGGRSRGDSRWHLRRSRGSRRAGEAGGRSRRPRARRRRCCARTTSCTTCARSPTAATAGVDTEGTVAPLANACPKNNRRRPKTSRRSSTTSFGASPPPTCGASVRGRRCRRRRSFTRRICGSRRPARPGTISAISSASPRARCGRFWSSAPAPAARRSGGAA